MFDHKFITAGEDALLARYSIPIEIITFISMISVSIVYHYIDQASRREHRNSVLHQGGYDFIIACCLYTGTHKLWWVAEVIMENYRYLLN